ncbi:DUF4175 family protein [Sneathiella glossodoripedis]|uniref:DUF4175 family protein n=1 Tax=Sneathiella glossodoripedis TaxID=418853 RepID=UPI000471C278
MDERDTDLVTNLKLQRKVAVFFILAERIWESSTALFCTVLLFVACTLSGLWEVLDPVLHLMALAGFLVALLFSVRHFRDQFHFPEQAEADARLERESNLSHRPVRSMAAVPKWLHDDNARSRYFWKLHQDQHHKKLGHVKYFLPKFGLSSSDKYSLRSLVILLLLSGYVVGGTAPFSHFRTAFKPHLGGEEISLAMDIWAAPPEYTGRAPQLIHQLTGEESRDLQAAEQGIKKFTLPEGAKLIGRVSGGGKDIPAFFVGDEQFPFEVIEGENFQIEVNEIGAGRWTLEKGGDTLISWDFEIIPDLPPIIKMLTLPAVTDRSALNIIALAEDDYGILDLKAQISKPDQPEILEIPLPFPSGSPVVESKSYHDLTAHAGRASLQICG